MDWRGWLEKCTSQCNCYKGAKPGIGNGRGVNRPLLKLHEDPTEKKKGEPRESGWDEAVRSKGEEKEFVSSDCGLGSAAIDNVPLAGFSQELLPWARD